MFFRTLKTIFIMKNLNLHEYVTCLNIPIIEIMPRDRAFATTNTELRSFTAFFQYPGLLHHSFRLGTVQIHSHN